MALSEPVLSGPGAGRTVTYGGGSSAELKLVGERMRGIRVVAVSVDDEAPARQTIAEHGLEFRVGIGRLVPDDVIGLVKYVRKHPAREQAA